MNVNVTTLITRKSYFDLQLSSYQINKLLNWFGLVAWLLMGSVPIAFGKGDVGHITLTAADQATEVAAGDTGRAVWRLNFTAEVTMTVGVTLTQLKLNRNGTLAPSQLTKVVLYQSNDASFDAGVDGSLTGGTFDVNGDLTLGGFSQFLGWDDPEVLGGGWSGMYPYTFVVVDVASDARIGDTFRLSLEAATWCDTTAAEHGVFPMTSSVISVVSPDQVVASHYSAAPAQVTQGTGAVLLHLTLATNQNTATLTNVRFSLIGSGVSSVKMYRETGTDGWQLSDTPVGTVVTSFPVGIGAINNLNEELTTAPKTYYLALSLSSTASLDQSPRLTLVDQSYLTAASPDVVAAFSAGSQAFTVADSPDVLTLTGVNLAPSMIDQGDAKAFLRLTLKTGADQAVWTGLSVSLTGNLPLGEIAALRLFRDADPNDGAWQTGDALVASLTGAEVGGNRIGALTVFQETVTTAAARYFLVVTPSSTATVNATLGVSLVDNSYLTVAGVDTVNSFSLGSSLVTLTNIPSQLTVSFTNQAPVNLTQSNAAAFVRLSLSASQGSIRWTDLRVTFGGSLSSGSYATNGVKLFKDMNADGILQAGTDLSLKAFTLQSSKIAQLNGLTETIDNAGKNYFLAVQVKSTAAAGDTIALTIGDATQLTLIAPDTVVSSNFPYGSGDTTTIQRLPITLLVSPGIAAPTGLTQQMMDRVLVLTMSTLSNASVTLVGLSVSLVGTVPPADVVVSVFRDAVMEFSPNGVFDFREDELLVEATFNPQGWATLSMIEVISSSEFVDPPSYFIVLKPSATAPIGAVMGVTMMSFQQVILGSPDVAATTNFPMGSSLVAVLDTSDQLLVTGRDVITPPATVRQLLESLALLVMTLRTNQDAVVVTSVAVSLTGNLDTNQIGAFKLFKDANADGTWQEEDQTLGLVAVFDDQRMGTFSALRETVTTSPSQYFLVVTPALNAAVGQTIGVTLANNGYLEVEGLVDTKAAFSVGSGLVSITGVNTFLTLNAVSTAPSVLSQGSGTVGFHLTLVSAGTSTFTQLRLSFSSNPGISAVKLFRENNTLLGTPVGPEMTGVWATLGGFTETLGMTPSIYYVVLSLASSASVGMGFQVTLNESQVTVGTYDTLLPFGISTPVITVADAPDRITLSAGAIGGSTHRVNRERPYAVLTLTVDQDSAVVTSLRVAAVGEVGLPRGLLKWYQDVNLDGNWDTNDPVIASATWVDGTALLVPQPLTLSGGPHVSFFTLFLSSDAPLLAASGLSLSSEALFIAGVDTLSPAAGFSFSKTVAELAALTLSVSGTDAGASAVQGTTGLTLIHLTLSNGSGDGEVSWVTTLSFSVGRPDDFTALWIQSGATTLATAARTGVGWSASFGSPSGFSGEVIWMVRGSVDLLAAVGTLRLTVTGGTAAAPDGFGGLAAVASVVVGDLGDEVSIGGSDGPALALAIGGSLAAVLEVTMRLSSVPQDAALIQGMVVSLSGGPSEGQSEAGFGAWWKAGVYRDNGNSVFNLGSDVLVASSTFSGRLATLSMSENLSGAQTSRYFISLSLSAEAPLPSMYGGTVGLSLAGVFTAGSDSAAMNGSGVSSLRRIYESRVHIGMGAGGSPTGGVALGALQALARVTLSADRDQATLKALVITHHSGPSADADFSILRLYRERDGVEGWSGGDESLAGGTLTAGSVSLSLRETQSITSVGLTLWVVGGVNPFLPLTRTLGLGLEGRFEESAVSDPTALTLSGRAVAATVSTLWVGASDFTSPVTLTGEPFLAFRLSLRSADDGVGVTAAAIRLNGVELLSLAPHVTARLYEGDRLMAVGVPTSTTDTFIVLSFALAEPVFSEPKYWDVVITPGAAPSISFSVTFMGEDLRFHDLGDVAAPFSRTTGGIEVVSGWGLATIQVTQTGSLVEPDQRSANRGASLPIGRLVLKTSTNKTNARLTILRLFRQGSALDSDVRVAAYLSEPTLTVFDAAQASRVGEGRFVQRAAALTLATKPFLTFAPRALWLVAEIQPGAMGGGTWGVEIQDKSFVCQGEVSVSPAYLPFPSPLITLNATAPAVVRATLSATALAPAVQGAMGVVWATLGVKVTSGTGSVLTGLRMTLNGDSGLFTKFRLVDGDGDSTPLTVGYESGFMRARMSLPVTEMLTTYRLMTDVASTVAPGATLAVGLGPDGLSGSSQDTWVVNGGGGWTSLALTARDAPDQLTVTGKARPVPWEVGEWVPAFLITLRVNQDEASLIRMTILQFGNLLTGELDNFRVRIGDTIVPVLAQNLGGGLIQLSLVNYPVTRLSSYPMGSLELSLSPSINLTGTLGLSLLGVGVAPDSVIGTVVDTVVMTPFGTTLLGIRHPARPSMTALSLKNKYVKGGRGLGMSWEAAVKQGSVPLYRSALVRLTQGSPDLTVLAESLSAGGETLGLPSGWAVLLPWVESPFPTLSATGIETSHGWTLYVAVQAQGSGGLWSEVAFSDPVVIDEAKPVFSARRPEITKGKRQMVLAWDLPVSGPSGVSSYLVERRKGLSALWEVISSVQAPRLDTPSSEEEWRLWYPSTTEVRGKRYETIPKEVSGNRSPALQLSSYQINKLINAPIESKLTPYLSSTSSILPLEDGTSYYRVKAVSGAGETSDPTEVIKVVSGAENLPFVVNDAANYPNPFDSRFQDTTIVYVLNQDVPVTVRVYTALGELVREWACEKGASGGQVGANEIVWDGVNGLGVKAATGAYLCVIQAQVSGGSGTRVVRKIGVIH